MQRRRCVIGVFSLRYLPSKYNLFRTMSPDRAKALRDSRGRALYLIKIPFSTPELFSFAHDWQRAVKKANALGREWQKSAPSLKNTTYCACPSKLWTIGQRSFSFAPDVEISTSTYYLVGKIGRISHQLFRRKEHLSMGCIYFGFISQPIFSLWSYSSYSRFTAFGIQILHYWQVSFV